MAKGVVDTQHLSPEAREWLDAQMTRIERHIIARGGLLAAQSNDDVILPSHLETAYHEVLGKRSRKKQMGIAITVSVVLGGVVEGLFGGLGKSVGEYIFHLLR